MSSTIIKILVPENYKYTNINMYYTFTNEIYKITGKKLTFVDFTINYIEKCCYLRDFFINENFGAVNFHKIILKKKPKIDPPLFNLFVFNKIM